MSTTHTAPTGAMLIAMEREKQIKKHQYTIEGDVKFNNHDQLSEAASILCINVEEGFQKNYVEHFENLCPYSWDKAVWKRMLGKPYYERLTIAGGLIAAELDRVNEIEKAKKIN